MQTDVLQLHAIGMVYLPDPRVEIYNLLDALQFCCGLQFSAVFDLRVK